MHKFTAEFVLSNIELFNSLIFPEKNEKIIETIINIGQIIFNINITNIILLYIKIFITFYPILIDQNYYLWYINVSLGFINKY